MFTGKETSLLTLLATGQVGEQDRDRVLTQLGPEALAVANCLIAGDAGADTRAAAVANALRDWATKPPTAAGP